MRKFIAYSFAVLVTFLLVVESMAGSPKWEFDKGHSNFYFEIKHIYASVRGHFEDYSGDFHFDSQQPRASLFDIRIQTNSLNTSNDRRDKHLRSEDFFDVGKFPEIRFQSTRVRRILGNQYEAEGNLTIKDVTRSVRVPFNYLGTRPNPFNKKQVVAGFEAHLALDRLQYHVGSGKYFEMGVVGKDVTLLITLEMVRNN
jgi:polyisoprenoid-binding protein YceI